MSTPPKPDQHRQPVAPIPLVRANAFEPFVSFLNEIGAPVERRLRQARVPVSLLDDPEALAPLFPAYRFVELAARGEQMEAFGVVVGQRATSFDRGDFRFEVSLHETAIGNIAVSRILTLSLIHI